MDAFQVPEMNVNDANSSVHPDHLSDLRRSGAANKTIHLLAVEACARATSCSTMS
jgi:hypothetical protein